MTSQTQEFGKAIRHLFADPVTYADFEFTVFDWKVI